MKLSQENEIPTHSWTFWGILLFLFLLVMILTIAKDWWLTTEQPNIAFYIFVPVLSILGGAFFMYGGAKIFKPPVMFLSLLAISFGVNILMQIVENIMKITYYLFWEYPGILYLVIVIPLGFLLLVFGLILWSKVRSWQAILLAICYFLGSTLIGAFLTNVIGLTTPGS